MVPQISNKREIEALLEIAEAKTQDPVVFDDTDVEQFIIKNNIKEGTTKVSSSIVYYYYVLWKNKRNIKRFAEFSHQFKKHFKSKVDNTETVFMLDGSNFDLSREGYFKARSFLRRQKYEKQKAKERNKAKQNKKRFTGSKI